MGPRDPRPRPLSRLDRALWTWRLSGKAGGTGTGWAVTQKATGVNAASSIYNSGFVTGWGAYPIPVRHTVEQ